MTILIIGNCGSGKTWIMQELLKSLFKVQKKKLGKIYFHESSDLILLGKYDGTIFQGSDRLSMSCITDIDKMLVYANAKTIIAEGDRFTNSTFIAKTNPIIVKILDDGCIGRIIRNSQQSDRHLKSIATRVANIKEHHTVNTSTDALVLIHQLLKTKKIDN